MYSGVQKGLEDSGNGLQGDAMASGVRVASSARLHLGFYNILGDGVAYGGFGVAISEPRVTVEVYPTSEGGIVVEGDHSVRGDVEKVARILGVDSARIVVKESIPRHVGLGSTTQLVLSTGAALSTVFRLGYSVRELAVKLGRGLVSGIGIACFEKGGFVMDSGRRIVGSRIEKPKTVDDLPKPVIQVSVPSGWYFIIAIPKTRKGLEDREEEPIITTPEKPPDKLQEEIYRSFLLGILPGIMNNDPVLFGKALSRIQVLIGRYFEKYQGGVFCCSETEYLVEEMRRQGVLGYGQSSWGPVAYGLVYGYDKALSIAENLSRTSREAGIEASIMVVKPRNHGARIEFIR